MQIEGSANPKMVERIERVITEHYDESPATLVSMNVTHVAFDEVYIVQVVTALETDDEYKVTAETVRVDITAHEHILNFTLLNEVELDLADDTIRIDLNHDSMDHK
jgi:hypothetical protein